MALLGNAADPGQGNHRPIVSYFRPLFASRHFIVQVVIDGGVLYDASIPLSDTVPTP